MILSIAIRVLKILYPIGKRGITLKSIDEYIDRNVRGKDNEYKTI